MTPLSTGYRPDIQGLRAIAVVLVILAHSGIPWVAGGFVGVDVFFVLSGFLITSLLLQEHEASGRLSFGAFYVRRLRRLLPALIAVVGVTALMVVLLFPEADRRLILASMPFAATWTSNLFFVLREQDYFNELGEKDVFLHTWSLGVEEQFYLLWPVLLLGLISLARTVQLKRGFIILVLLSFSVSLVWSYWLPISAFYMMPARIWQFGLGGLIYLYAVSWRGSNVNSPRRGGDILLALGLTLIFGAAFLLDDQRIYPGYWVLLPSLGTAFVILAGNLRQTRTKTSWILENPLSVWIGDRSYSLYLWHWPTIVILGHLGINIESDHRGFWLSLLLTLLLAIISYQWIELPFWKKKLRTLPPRMFLLGTCAVVLLTLAVTFHIQRTQKTNTVEPTIELATSIRNDLPALYRFPCDAWYRHAKVEPCVVGPDGAPNTAVLLADSIGAQWFSAWAKIFSPPDWRLVVLTKSACALVDEDYFYPRIGKIYDVCRQWREAVLEQITSFSPKVIIVGSAATYDFSPEQWVEGSRRVLASLSAKTERVLVISGTPTLGFDGPSCIARQLQAKNKLVENDCIGENTTEKFNQVARFLSIAARDFSNVQVFNPVDVVCPAGQCRAISPNGVAVFRDSQHLTDTFVRSTVETLRKQLADISNTN
jgi:peptidoglycan/LPS O-acetylase OafA/YrhL